MTRGVKFSQHHVGYGNQLPQDLQGIFRAQVEGHAELAVVQRLKSPAALPVELARVVVGIGAVEGAGGVHELIVVGVHLDDLGAQVGQVRPAIGHGEHPAQVHHADAFQWQGCIHVRTSVKKRHRTYAGERLYYRHNILPIVIAAYLTMCKSYDTVDT